MEGDTIADWDTVDDRIKNEFPIMCSLAQSYNNFYVAVGYALLTQLSRVEVEMRKEVIFQIKRYLNEGTTQTTNPSLNSEVEPFLVLLQNSTNPSAVPHEISQTLRTRSITLCAAFQIILAAIFRASHKAQEAEGILKGEDVNPANKWYFLNLAKSLYICVRLYQINEDFVEYVEDTRDVSVMIHIFVPSKSPLRYAALRHVKEIEFDISREIILVKEYPFLKVKKGKFLPKVGVAPMQRSSITQANPSQNAPTPPIYTGNIPSVVSNPAQVSNQVINKPPIQGTYSEPLIIPKTEIAQQRSEVSPKKSDSENLEEVLIEKLLKIFNEDDLMLTKSEAKELKKLSKAAKKENNRINTLELKNFILRSKNCCKFDHDPKRFVIFQTCGKRHCIDCLSKAGTPAEIICDCRQRLKAEDMEFRFGLASKNECFVCGKAAYADDSIIGKNGRYIHKGCF